MAAVICRQSILNNSWPDYARLALAEARDSIETNYILWECAITCLVGAKVWFQCHYLLASPIHNLVLDLRNCWTNWMKSACPADITAAGVIRDFLAWILFVGYLFKKLANTLTKVPSTEYGGSGPLRFAKPQSCKASLALHASKASKPQSCKASLAPQASKPQSSKASLVPHASKLQSLFGASRFKASKPQSLNAWMLWRFGAWRLFQALALLGAFPTPQSLKASKPERLDAVALWRFGAWRLLHALALLDAFPAPQSLKAWTLGCFGALARVLRLKTSKPQSLNAWMLWRFGALALGALDALVPLGPLALCGSLTLWRFGAWRSWCFGASWPFGALRLFDALALLGALRLRGSVTLWHFAALWDMPSWKKSDFVDFTFFQARRKNKGPDCLCLRASAHLQPANLRLPV